MKTLTTLLTILFLSVFSLQSQDLGTRILKGKIVDKNTGKPLDVDIQFEDSKGKKFKIKSNSLTGNYEQLLNSNETYIITFLRFDVLRDETEIKITPPDTSFDPQMQDFEVLILSPGAELFDYDLFESKSPEISENGMKQLERLKKIMRFNGALNINIEIHSEDSFDVASPEAKQLSDSRLSKLKSVTDSWGRFNRKVNYISSQKPGEDKISDTRVVVDKVEDSMK